jgi:hypothetical protein
LEVGSTHVAACGISPNPQFNLLQMIFVTYVLPFSNQDPDKHDASSIMIVVAGIKRKHSKKPAEDLTNDGLKNSNDGSNTYFSSDKKRIRI